MLSLLATGLSLIVPEVPPAITERMQIETRCVYWVLELCELENQMNLQGIHVSPTEPLPPEIKEFMRGE